MGKRRRRRRSGWQLINSAAAIVCCNVQYNISAGNKQGTKGHGDGTGIENGTGKLGRRRGRGLI